MDITKYPVSAFTIASRNGTCIAVDFGRDVPDYVVEGCEVDALVCSHVHPDHCHVAHAEQLGVQTYAAAEAAHAFQAAGIATESLHPGSQFRISGVEFTAFTVDHGDISAPIVNLGFRIVGDETSVWYAGDIAVDSCPRPDGPFDAVLLPIGGFKVFDAERAINYLIDIDHRGIVIPIHFDFAPARLSEFVSLSRTTRFEVVVIGNLQSLELAS